MNKMFGVLLVFFLFIGVVFLTACSQSEIVARPNKNVNLNEANNAQQIFVGGNLIGKGDRLFGGTVTVVCNCADTDGACLPSTTLTYDDEGNVIEEVKCKPSANWGGCPGGCEIGRAHV